MLLVEKVKIFGVSEFSILPYTQNRKLGNLGKSCFTSNFDSSCNLRSKNDKKLTETKESKTTVVSGIPVRNDKLNGKGKNVNPLLKRRCEVEKIVCADNSNITVSILNHSGLHLNEGGTTRLVNNLCSTLAK